MSPVSDPQNDIERLVDALRCDASIAATDDDARLLHAAADELERLRQFIEHEVGHTQDPSTWANLEAAVDGQYLYQKLPGWDESDPLRQPLTQLADQEQK